MPGTYAYTRATQILQVTGGTSGAPATWNDAYLADLAGTLTLKAASAPSATFTLTYQIQPAEELAQIITLTVAGKTPEIDYLVITGTDAWGGAIVETLAVSVGNGAYVTSLHFRTITNIDCSDNAAGGGTVWADGTLAVTQPRWGVVGERIADRQYYISANLTVGDGSTATYFQSSNEEIYFADGYNITRTNAATLASGYLLASYGRFGSTWSLAPAVSYELQNTTSGSFLLYDSVFHVRSNTGVFFTAGTVDIRNSTLSNEFSFSVSGADRYFRFQGTGITLSRVTITGMISVQLRGAPVAAQDIHLHGSYYGVDCLSAAGIVLSGTRITSSSSVEARVSTADLTLVDPVGTITLVTCGAADLITVKRTVNINVNTPAGVDLAGVTVACTRAHLMTGSDGNVYRCIAPIAAAVDATHKPITGADWATYWQLTAYAAGTGGAWTTGAAYVAAEAEFSVATGATGDIAAQTITTKRWTGTSEILEAFEHSFSYAILGYPTFRMPNILITAPIDWEQDLMNSRPLGVFENGAWR